ncbi:hypothetical protein AQUCO_03800150v1 [Aquilegia coerulea]|uniref:Uncharacterized protein n=1 Tax=Aquilegia coerulea TaxID=218851 RepID=A0A2G5CSU3_AQUCA|nr:hypothetical protein AQUCO_03800150v1 [Aquilegia coerulea]
MGWNAWMPIYAKWVLYSAIQDALHNFLQDSHTMGTFSRILLLATPMVEATCCLISPRITNVWKSSMLFREAIHIDVMKAKGPRQ